VMLGSWRESPWTPWSSKPSREMARATLDRLGIGELRGRHIRALSGGQQQRVFLARALVGKPDVLLLDEPTSGVDIRTRHEVMHLLLELNRAGTTIVLTTHDLNAVSSHATRLLCIADGSIVGDGTPEEVLTPDVLRRTYGAEMLVMRHNGTLYVVEANDSMAIPHVAGS
jgi:zinc/manganese transport system ATP-binding protein